MHMVDFLKKGDVCDLVKTLSSEGRDYLVRSNGDQLKIESLHGKIVGIWVNYLSKELLASCYNTIFRNMIETYNQLFVRGDFEIVFVAIPKPETETDGDTNKDKNEDLFDALFSTMPWLAIPYFDLGARMRFKNSAYLHSCLFIDKQGMVGDTWRQDDFIEYGTELYPFTAERRRDLIMECEKALEERTVRSFLSAPSRDYVISNTKERVPISELEEKVVGLYFYKSGQTSAMLLMPVLIKVYEELKKRGENFEIVMINLRFLRDHEDNERIFEDEFKLMPWLALPYKDPSCRKLMRMFQLSDCFSYDDHVLRNLLVIVGPGGNIFDCNGADVLFDYGIDAYPFTMKAITEKKISNLETCTLQYVLDTLDIEFAFAKCGEQIHISHLTGKSVILFIGGSNRLWDCKLMQRQFPQNHGYQVIYVSGDYDLPSFHKFVKEMPCQWLTLPFDIEKADSLMRSLQAESSPCLMVFGPEGRLLRDKSGISLEDPRISLDPGENNDHEPYNNIFEKVYLEIENLMLPMVDGFFSDVRVKEEDDDKENEENYNCTYLDSDSVSVPDSDSDSDSDGDFYDRHVDIEFKGNNDHRGCASQCKRMLDTDSRNVQVRAEAGIYDNLAGLSRKRRGLKECEMVVSASKRKKVLVSKCKKVLVVRASKRKKVLVSKRTKVLVSKRKKVLVARASKRASKHKKVLVSTDHQGIKTQNGVGIYWFSTTKDFVAQ